MPPKGRHRAALGAEPRAEEGRPNRLRRNRIEADGETGRLLQAQHFQRKSPCELRLVPSSEHDLLQSDGSKGLYFSEEQLLGFCPLPGTIYLLLWAASYLVWLDQDASSLLGS